MSDLCQSLCRQKMAKLFPLSNQIIFNHINRKSIQYEANINPLFTAASGNDVHVFRDLIGINTDIININDMYGNTLLHHAAMGGNEEIVEFLLDYGFNPYTVNNEGIIPIFYAVSGNHLGVFQKLFGYCLEQLQIPSDKHGNTILHYAAIGGNEEIVQRLVIEDEFAPNFCNHEQVRPVFYAASGGHWEVFNNLLDFEFGNSCKADVYGNTILHYAFLGGNRQIVAMVINLCDYANPANNEGIIPILLAASSGHLDIFRNFAHLHLKYNVTDKHGNTVLHYAAVGGNRQIVEISRNYCSHPTAANNDGVLPIFLAASRGHLDVFRELARFQIDWNVADKNGKTVLCHAKMGGNTEIMKILLNKGINPNQGNSQDVTAISHQL